MYENRLNWAGSPVTFDVIQLALSQKMTTAQVFEASFSVINSHIQDYSHPDGHVQLTYEMTPGFQPFTC